MIYSFNLSIVDLFSIVLAVFILGMMVGWKWLPPPKDRTKENLINQLWEVNEIIKERFRQDTLLGHFDHNLIFC